MKRDAVAGGPVVVPGVVSLAASSRRTLKHGDSFAMFDEFGDVFEVEHSPAGLFHHDTRYLARLELVLDTQRCGDRHGRRKKRVVVELRQPRPRRERALDLVARVPDVLVDLVDARRVRAAAVAPV